VFVLTATYHKMSLRNTRLADVGRQVGQSVTVHGWVTHLRSSGKIAFAVIRDGSSIAQAVFVKTQLPPDVWSAFRN
jgi:asparaginyl-tRNA synthetase